MLFSTPFFLFVFLPVFFLLYALVPARRAVLLLGSLVFYGWSEPIFTWVVVASALLDWLLGFKIAKGGSAGKWSLRLGIASNIGLLLYAKYTVFAISNINGLLHYSGWQTLTVPQIALPLGVSFIVFEKITYLVDLHRHSAPPAKSFFNYLNYVFLFPKLLAGPIVKYHDIAGQLEKPSHRYEDIREGLIRFLIGLGKKVLIADSLAPMADEVFKLSSTTLDTGTAWLGLACFTLQIFFDFSGYSDMAIGLGRIMGFRLLENFNAPYLATSFTDFWRRWHISLSSWIKEYLYIPLGGSRVSPMRAYVNLTICFMLSGLWHGASWNFIIWGLLHGLVLVIDRAFWLKWSTQHLPRFINMAITLFLVMLTWVFFRCEQTSHAWSFLQALFGSSGNGLHSVLLDNDVLCALIIGAVIVFRPLLNFNFDLSSGSNALSRGLAAVFVRTRATSLAWGCLLLILCLGRLSVNSFNPFLYFRF